MSSAKTRIPGYTINSKKKVSNIYYLPRVRNNVTENLNVCRSAFVSITRESRHRIQLICNKFLEQGATRFQKRVVVLDKSEKIKFKRQEIKTFIKKLVPIQRHYCRGKYTVRQYLDSHLSVKKMWELYCIEDPDRERQVSTTFSKVLSMITLILDLEVTDKCSTCSCLEYKIAASPNEVAKSSFKLQLNTHKELEDAFYEALRQED